MQATGVPSIVLLPRSYRDSDELHAYATRLRDLRLHALRSDPWAFTSSYAHESAQPLEFHANRLLNPEARHYIVVLPQTKDHNPEQPMEPLKCTWEGILVLLGPRTIDPHNFDNVKSAKAFTDGTPRPVIDNMSKSTLLYLVASVFIDSQFRRRGLAKGLTLAALNTIRAEAKETQAITAICIVGTDKYNLPAQKCYSDVGFNIVAEDQFKARDGRDLEEVIMRQDIAMEQ